MEATDSSAASRNACVFHPCPAATHWSCAPFVDMWQITGFRFHQKLVPYTVICSSSARVQFLLSSPCHRQNGLYCLWCWSDCHSCLRYTLTHSSNLTPIQFNSHVKAAANLACIPSSQSLSSYRCDASWWAAQSRHTASTLATRASRISRPRTLTPSATASSSATASTSCPPTSAAARCSGAHLSSPLHCSNAVRSFGLDKRSLDGNNVISPLLTEMQSAWQSVLPVCFVARLVIIVSIKRRYEGCGESIFCCKCNTGMFTEMMHACALPGNLRRECWQYSCASLTYEVIPYLSLQHITDRGVSIKFSAVHAFRCCCSE